MTQNQIAWLAFQESKRHNLATEAHNVVRVGSELSETRRHNKASEELESSSIQSRARSNVLNLMEMVRSNHANENIRRSEIAFNKYKARLDSELAYRKLDIQKSISAAEIAQRDRQLAASRLAVLLENATRRYNTDVLDRISKRKFELGLRNLISSEKLKTRELDLKEATDMFNRTLNRMTLLIKMNDSLGNRNYQSRMASVAEGRLTEESLRNQTERLEVESKRDYRRTQNLQQGLNTVVNLVSTGLKVLTPYL